MGRLLRADKTIYGTVLNPAGALQDRRDDIANEAERTQHRHQRQHQKFLDTSRYKPSYATAAADLTNPTKTTTGG